MNTDPAAKADPLPIIEEYLRAAEPRIRANAVTALAAVATPESVSRLVETALLDEASVVRDRARIELRELDHESSATAARCLSAALEDPEKQVAANAVLANGVLARLDHAGPPVILPGSFFRRLRLAARVRSAETSRRERRLDLAAARSGLWGGLAGALLVAAVMVLGLRPGVSVSHYSTLFWWTLWLSPAFALWTSGWATPIGAYFDRRAAAVVEVLAAARGALIPMFLFFAMASWIHEAPTTTVFVGTLCGVIGVASIRGGTLAKAGRHATLLSAVAGGGAGAVVLTGIVAGVRVVIDSTTDARLASFAAGMWLLLVPAGFGMARAFSGVDGDSAEDGKLARGSFRRSSVVLAFALPAFWVVCLFALPSNQRLPILAADPDEPLRIEKSFIKIPTSIYVHMVEAQRLHAEIDPSEGARDERLVLDLRHDGDVEKSAAAPEPLDYVIRETGLYSLEVTSRREVAQSRQFFWMANRFAPIRIDFGEGKHDQKYDLSVRLSRQHDERGSVP